MSLWALAVNIVDNLAQDVCEETIVPFAGSGIWCTIESFITYGFGVDYIGNTFCAVQPFEGRQQHSPSICFTCPWRANHHEAVLNFLDLIKLQNLVHPLVACRQLPLVTDIDDVLAQNFEIHRNVVNPWKHVGQLTGVLKWAWAKYSVSVNKYTLLRVARHLQQVWARWSLTLWMRILTFSYGERCDAGYCGRGLRNDKW